MRYLNFIFRFNNIQLIILILIWPILLFNCSINKNPIENEKDLNPIIIINDIQSALSVEMNPDNGKLESKIYYFIKYHFENCYGIIDHYSVEIDTFGGRLYNIDYAQPFSSNNELSLKDLFWMSTDFYGLDSVVIYFTLYSMFWTDSSFSSKLLGYQTKECSKKIPIIRNNANIKTAANTF